MSEQRTPPPAKDREGPEPSPTRRPYVKPAITTEEIFERQALSCGSKFQSCENPPWSRQGS